MTVGDFLVDGSADAPTTIVLAHGAGAPMNSAYMDRIAHGLAGDTVRVVRFEFPYMRARREGRRPPPDREGALLATWRDVFRQFEPSSTVIGGKSMGGRMASMIADEMGPLGVVCLGYPFHAPGRPDRPRIDHLRAMSTPALIVQGTRDPFGKPEEVTSTGSPA